MYEYNSTQNQRNEPSSGDSSCQVWQCSIYAQRITLRSSKCNLRNHGNELQQTTEP